MNQTKTLQQAYEIIHDLDRIEGFDEWEELGSADILVTGELARRGNLFFIFTEPELIESIEEIRTEGAHIQIEGLDYIVTSPDLPVISKRMLSVLKSVKDFPHQTIPVVIEDTVLVTGADGKLQPSGKVNTDYVAVQLIEHLDILDREKSDYDTDDDDPDEIEYINKLVLDVPSEGLPPIFRIVDDPIVLYVSPEAKTALEEAEITGIRFVEIDY